MFSYRIICSVVVVFILYSNLVPVRNPAAADQLDDIPEDDKIPLPSENCAVADDVCQEESVSLQAIRELHQQIDDDRSGEIDMAESEEFWRVELENRDGDERKSIFHGRDQRISVRDLWHAWKLSPVYNWTVDDVVEWLTSFVELPQYTALFQNFLNHGFNGSYLPRLAVNRNHFISKDLGIKAPIHKRKLSLKAMDAVLFGAPKKSHNIFKDIALLVTLLLALGGCWFAYVQTKKSKIQNIQMQNMMQDLEVLHKADQELSELNTKLQRAESEQHEARQEKRELELKYRGEIDTAKQEAERLKTERQGSNLEEMSRLQLTEDELQQVRAALVQAEKELELTNYWGAPSELQQWLQYTFELEQQHFTAKQQAAQRQFGSAREACEKMRRKRTGVLASLRMAQGNSIDDIDQRILQARLALEEIRHDLQERQQRWANIENFCGYPIRSNAGIAKLELALYGDTASEGSGSGVRIATSLVAPLPVADADEDMPPQYPTATAMLFQTPKANGCTRSQSSYSDLKQRRSSKPGMHSSGLGELKRRPVNMGSTNSLSRTQSQAATKRDSIESITVKATQSSPVSQDPGVTFQLGTNSPTSSPESPIEPPLSSKLISDNSKMPRSKSLNVTNNIQQNGSKIPMMSGASMLSKIANDVKIPTRDMSPIGKPVTAKESKPSIGERCSSDNNLQKRLLTKQSQAIGSIAGTSGLDNDSLSGNESNDSEGKKKEKRRLKFIPKLMRKTEHEKQKP